MGNEPDEERLLAMLESAEHLAGLALASTGRRRVGPDGRGLDGGGESITVPWPPAQIAAMPPPATNYTAAIFDQALAKALREPGSLSAADQIVVAGSLEVITDRVRRLRELVAAQTNAVLGHALNSIELGLIGLAKVMEGEDGAEHV